MQGEFMFKIENGEKFELPLPEALTCLRDTFATLPPIKKRPTLELEHLLPQPAIQERDESLEQLGSIVFNNNKTIKRIMREVRQLITVMNVKEGKMDQNFSAQFYTQDDFPYYISLDTELEMPLYKERNFCIELSVRHSDSQGLYVNQVPIQVTVALYLTTNPPKRLEHNIFGNNVLRIKKKTEIEGGKCMMKNVKIKEVTSHLPNSCIAIVFSAVNNPEIKPLIIENVVVKAKRKA